MKSPFPGMDPYLEPYWGNLHTRMMVVIADQLLQKLPQGLWARVEETISIDSGEEGVDPSYFRPDAFITETNPFTTGGQAAETIAVAEPLIITGEPRTDRHIEIVDTAKGERVVTVIEVLSTSNKIGDHGRDEYRRKQSAYLRTSVNLVEIDLLRAGHYTLSAPLDEIPQEKLSAYAVCVRRAYPRAWEFYPISMRTKLPTFRVPLRPSDLDTTIDLQAVIDQCYANGGFARAIKYDANPESVKDPTELAWIGQLLREKGLRPN